MNYLKPSVLFLMAILLLSGCGSRELQGTVTDPFGNAIEGVTVSIENSDLKSSTGKDGRYSIPGLLGTIILKYSKSGYTTQRITLTEQEKTHFPAQPLTIYPIPQEPGLYYLGEKNLIKISPGKIVISETREKATDSMQDLLKISKIKFFPDKIMESDIRPGKAQFIDTSSINLVPMRLRSDGCFLHLLIYPQALEVQVAYEYLVREDKTPKGEEKLIVRTIHCDPGSYAWVEFYKDTFGSELPKPKGTCYAFSIKSQ